MKQPFEGLFGDTCESRILQFLLPMYGIEFDMAELTEEIKLTRQSISKVMRKFSSLGIVKMRKEGRNLIYSINEESPLVKRIEDLDNTLIESMIGPEEFKKIQKSHEKRVRANSPKPARQVIEPVTLRHDVSGDAVSYVASGSGHYLKERISVKR
jgi:predicted transcriptional regulator